ncbi:MAG: hypothetical protein A3G81_34440 [Betaproteobacteria bacterium RIFCSPLOWO2_12_FULL_65_14]|nr:MAG: hypothetical protein A3G81_34440 [Betaproteobacteria bacterium RIFCSPLOWO2_12_FULL_65_14]
MNSRLLVGLLLAIFLGVGPSITLSQTYPTKPIKFVVPYPPGGSGDFLGRLYSEYLSRAVGSTVLVENKPGAATNIALEQFARAEPDGYTLLLGTGQTMINMTFGPKPTVDPFSVLAPVAMIAEMPFMIAANPSTGIGSVKDMIAKSKAERLTISHAQFEAQVKLLTMATGAVIDSIPYKGGAPSVMAAIGGQVSLVAAYVPVLMGQVKGGKLRAVGIAATSRMNVLPDVATFAEQGFPKFTTTIWYSVLAPKGTPEPVLAKLTAATLNVVKDAQFVQRLQAGGAEALPGTPDDVITTMRKEQKVWVEVANAK